MSGKTLKRDSMDDASIATAALPGSQLNSELRYRRGEPPARATWLKSFLWTPSKARDSPGKEEKGNLETKSESEQEDEQGNEYVPEKIRAERETASGMEYLVEWEDYPDDKDWTWEIGTSLMSSVPDFITTWMERNTEDGTTDSNGEEADGRHLVHIAEQILAKRKFQSVPHYLVNWQGYSDPKDRTWEPCDRLAVGIPDMVDDYEAQQRSKK